MHICLAQRLMLFLIDKNDFVAFIIKVTYAHYLKLDKKKIKVSLLQLQGRPPLLILAQTCLIIHTALNLLSLLSKK